MTPQRITRAYLIVTNQCQLRCRYCWTHKDNGNMDTETALDAVKFVLKGADEEGVIPTINFFGGEPLLRWTEVIVPCIEFIRKEYRKPCGLGITTNCLLLDREKLQFLRGHEVDILASIDGTRETHDLNRRFPDGTGSFQAVQKNVPLLLEYYPGISVRMTLTPETAGKLFDDVQYLLQSGFQKVECVPNSFVPWPEESVEVIKGKLRRLSDDYIEHFAARGPSGGFREFERGFRDVKRVNYRYHAGEHRTDGCVRCGIGNNNQAAINYLGDVYPCHEAGCDEELRIGNIYLGLDKKKRIALAKGYDQQKVHGADCGGCKYDHVCNGGCSVFNYMMYRDFNQMPQMACVWKQLILDESEYILGRMAEQKNVCFRDYFRSL